MKKQAVIFDFDDTLVYTNRVFEQVKQSYYAKMKDLGLFDHELPAVLNYFDLENVKYFKGLAKECFPWALRQTYGEYCRRKNLPIDEKTGSDLEAMGWEINDLPVCPVPGAQALLKDLQADYYLFLLTQGDLDIQQKRVEKSGLLGFFEKLLIFHRKDSSSFAYPVLGKGLALDQSWSLGNSLRSDIMPAVRVGMKAIHVKADCWDYEHVSGQGFYYQVDALADCRTLLDI